MRRTRCATVAVLAALIGGTGCVNTGHYRGDGPPLIGVPPPGSVPTGLSRIVLPEYVLSPPDGLTIEVATRSRARDPGEEKDPNKGKDKDKKPADDPKEGKEVLLDLPLQPISSAKGGPFLVRPDGTVHLGIWGSVPVAGLTLNQAADAIRQHVANSETLRSLSLPASAVVATVDVVAYNSQRYYVITDGGGAGEQGAAFPITGSETVLDAIMAIGGLPQVASKRNIWVARRTPHAGQTWQILPVDWVGISQHGVETTNYQLLPGDRVYVKAQRLVTIDTAMARVLSPIERLFGITLLGASSVNNIQGRGAGFGNTGN